MSSTVPTNNPMVAHPVTGEVMPKFMRILTLEHTHRQLVYVLRRPDNDFNAPKIEAILRNVKRVPDEHNMDVYSALACLVHALNQYMRMEESCLFSSKYRKDLDSARTRVGVVLEHLENGDPAVLAILAAYTKG